MTHEDLYLILTAIGLMVYGATTIYKTLLEKSLVKNAEGLDFLRKLSAVVDGAVSYVERTKYDDGTSPDLKQRALERIELQLTKKELEGPYNRELAVDLIEKKVLDLTNGK